MLFPFSGIGQQQNKEKDNTTIYDIVDKEAKFPGNIQEWISKNIIYPQLSINNKEQGRVFAQFVVEKNGSISNIQIMRGVTPSLDAEVIRVFKKMPKWKPAKVKGKAVRSYVRIPVNFELS